MSAKICGHGKRGVGCVALSFPLFLMSDPVTDSTITEAVNDAAADNAKYDFFESGVALSVVSKKLEKKDGTPFTKALAMVRTKFKPEGAENWQESKWFDKKQMLILRDRCDAIIAEMEAIEATV